MRPSSIKKKKNLYLLSSTDNGIMSYHCIFWFSLFEFTHCSCPCLVVKRLLHMIADGLGLYVSILNVNMPLCNELKYLTMS